MRLLWLVVAIIPFSLLMIMILLVRIHDDPSLMLIIKGKTVSKVTSSNIERLSNRVTVTRSESTSVPQSSIPMELQQPSGFLQAQVLARYLQETTSQLDLNIHSFQSDVVTESVCLRTEKLHKIEYNHRYVCAYIIIFVFNYFVNRNTKSKKNRKPRSGEVSTRRFMELLQNDPDVSFFVLKSQNQSANKYEEGTPDVVTTMPISYSTEYRIDKPFGGWHAAFVDTVTNQNVDKLTAAQKIGWQPPPYYAVFKNAWVNKGYVILCNRTYGTGACMWDSPKEVPKTTKETYDIGAVVCDTWCAGYFHWTHEHLPRVAMISSLFRNNKNAKLVVPIKSGFQSEFLNLLGIPSSQILKPDNYKFKQLYFPQPQRCGNVFSQTLFILRRVIFESLPLIPNTKQNLVILAERKKGSRMPRNYAAVKKQLIKTFSYLSFQVHLDMKVIDQIQMFRTAIIAYGPHGANLANILFMSRGSNVIEMIPFKKANLCYYSTSQRLDLKYHIMPHSGGNYEVNFEELEKHFNQSLEKRIMP